MASAGLLKILHSGLQDERLLPPKGQPKIEDFQKVFVKTGRFTTEWYRVDFDNSPNFGQTAKATLPRRGHLITRAFLMVTLPDIRTPQLAAQAAAGSNFVGPTFGWTNSIGHALVSQAQFSIGAAPIDTLDGRLLEVLDEFHTPLEKTTTVNRMIGRHDNGFTQKSNGWNTQYQELAIPLPFWFARGDPSDAFPIDAIGTDTVQIGITFANTNAVHYTDTRILPNDPSPMESSACPVLPDLAMPTITNSPFYQLDPSGTPMTGLDGTTTPITVSDIIGIRMPPNLSFQDAYILLEYVYLDKPEANRIRLGDISYPIVQHYAINPYDTNSNTSSRIRMRIPNPTREFYFFVHRKDADSLNAPFLATRDISGAGQKAPWWPDASGLNTKAILPLVPAYSVFDSEPISGLSLIYEGKFIRYATDSPAFFRSILPSVEQRKTPWHNKYYYHIPFGTNHEKFGISNPMGHANLDKIQYIDLALNFKPYTGTFLVTNVPDYTVYVWAETYNILRVYSGRAGLLFAY